MKRSKSFPFEEARRITFQEVKKARKAIEKKLGEKRKFRGRPPKLFIEKYHPISIRLHPKVLAWAKARAKKQRVGYQTIINDFLLKKVA